MRFNSQAILTGIKSSKGQIDNGAKFDSTTFFLAIDLGTSSFGESIGQVSRPFKCGDSTEIEKWKAYKASWPVGGVAVDCVFEMAAGSQDSSKMVLVSIAPTPRQKAA